MDRSDTNKAFGNRIWIPAVLSLGTFIVYASNTCRSLWLMDSGEFVFHSTVLGIPHPTGYPLYIQLGKLLTLLPYIDGPFAINLFSALMASFTVLLLYMIIEYLEGERLASAVASLLFAFSFTFWWQAEIAEVYTLHAFFLVLMLYLLLKMRYTDDRRIFFLLSFIMGLSFTHHMSTVLMIPAVVYFVWVYRRREILSIRILLPSVVMFVIGLSVYLFIPMRAHLPPPFNYPQIHGVDPGEAIGLFWLVTGRIVKADMFQYGLGELDKPITYYFVILMRDFLYVGFLLGIYGALSQFHRDRRTFLTIFLAFLTYFVFFVNYGVTDQYVFFIPSFLFWSIWIGVGLSALTRNVFASELPGLWGITLRSGFTGVLILFVGLSLVRDYEQLDFTDKRGPDNFARMVLGHVEDDALISSIYEATPLLWYHHYIGRMKPGVEISDRGLMSLNVRQEMIDTLDVRSPLFENQVAREYKKHLEDHLIGEVDSRPCYLVRYDSFLNDRFLLEEIERGFYRVTVKEGPGYHLGEIPDLAFPGGFRYNERLDISGLDVNKTRLMEGELFRVKIFWSAVRPLKDNYRAVLRFMQDRDLEEHELKENSFLGIYTLGGGLIPPDDLLPGMLVVDTFDCIVPPDTRGGTYRVSLALIEEERFYSVPKEELSLDYLDLGTVIVNEYPGIEHYWD
jgi:hypothetical protein